jgi:adenosylmethionine-8-amino-7-oxononanoate aminotransferase
MLERGLIQQVRTLGDRLSHALHVEFGQHPNIGDIRGRGLFQGLELVEDRDAKTPFDPTKKLAARIKAEAMQAGLICYPMSGTRDGQFGDHILLAPPFIMEESQIEEVTQKLSAAISASL